VTHCQYCAQPAPGASGKAAAKRECAARGAGAVVRSVRLTRPRRRRGAPGGPVTTEERAAAAQDSKRACWPTCIAISPYDGHVYVSQYKARGAARRRSDARPPVSLPPCGGVVSARAHLQIPLLGAGLARSHGRPRRWLAGLCAREPRQVRPRAGARRDQRHTSGQQLPHATLPRAVRGAQLGAWGHAAGQRSRTAGSPLQSGVSCTGCSSSRGHWGCSTVGSTASLRRAHRMRRAPRSRACWCCTARRCAPCALWPSATCWRSRRASRSLMATSTSRGARASPHAPQSAPAHSALAAAESRGGPPAGFGAKLCGARAFRAAWQHALLRKVH